MLRLAALSTGEDVWPSTYRMAHNKGESCQRIH